MDTYYPLLITSAILLLPLVPASIIYLLLTPSKDKNTNTGRGEYEGQFFKLGKIRIEFNIFGSTATYVLVMFFTYFIHNDMELQKIKRLSLQDQQAWLVEVPVGLTDTDRKPIKAINEEMQQVMITLEPGNVNASASTLQFWVVPNKGKFPTVNFTMPGARSRITRDLNDQNLTIHDHGSRKMKGVVPIWFEIGEAYAQ